MTFHGIICIKHSPVMLYRSDVKCRPSEIRSRPSNILLSFAASACCFLLAGILYWLDPKLEIVLWLLIFPVPLIVHSLRFFIHDQTEVILVTYIDNHPGDFLQYILLSLEFISENMSKIVKCSALGIFAAEISIIIPKSWLLDWRERPWSFGFGNIVYAFITYTLICNFGYFIIYFVMKMYRGRKSFERLHKALIEASALCVVAISVSMEDASLQVKDEKERIWKRRCPSYQYVERQRLLEFKDLLGDISCEALSHKIWAHYLDFKKQATMNYSWEYFYHSCFHGVFPRADYSHSLLAHVLDEEELFIKMRMITEKVNLICESNKGQEILQIKLQKIIDIVAVLVLIFVILPMWGANPESDALHLGISLTPTFVALTVIFGTTISNTIQAMVYVLAVHEFEVGDEILVDGQAYFTVKCIGLLWTRLQSAQGIMVYYPNSCLMEKSCVNLTRSEHLSLRIEMLMPKMDNESLVAEGIQRRLTRECPGVSDIQVVFSTANYAPSTASILVLVQYRIPSKSLQIKHIIHKKLWSILKDMYPDGGPLTEMKTISVNSD